MKPLANNWSLHNLNIFLFIFLVERFVTFLNLFYTKMSKLSRIKKTVIIGNFFKCNILYAILMF